MTNIYKVRTVIEVDAAFGITFTASPEVRDRAWNLIEKYIGQKTCKLIRIDDTGFYISPNKAYDNDHCLHIAFITAAFANDKNIEDVWRTDVSAEKFLKMPLRYHLSIKQGLLDRLDIQKLNKIWRSVLEQFSLEKITEAVSKKEGLLISLEEIDKLIASIEAGYRKVKFSRHDFLYRFFLADTDLSNLEELLSKARSLRQRAVVTNIASKPHQIEAIRLKWLDWGTAYTCTEFMDDLESIKNLLDGMKSEISNSDLINEIRNLRDQVAISVPE